MNKTISHSLFTDFDISLFKTGKHFRLYEKLGSRKIVVNEQKGCYFAVYAPDAKRVSVIGDFNSWAGHEHELYPRWDKSGIWEGFIPDIGIGEMYKYQIWGHHSSYVFIKSDPYALFAEVAPKTASIVTDISYKWEDKAWMKNRKKKNGLTSPFSVYEVHLASWKRNKEEKDRSLTYRELAVELVNYVKEMGYTHVELMPVMEHPYEPSWGYQVTGFFAPNSRMGNPQDLMFLIDSFHQNNIGVLLDWVPAHFPSDGHGLAVFDGSNVYEAADPRKGYHKDWKTHIFNYERAEVKAFLISSALFWYEKYHIDGIRVDAVTSMLFLDYSREEGEWEPNEHGGNENLAAISFLKELNETVYKFYPDVQMIAEESTAYPGVSKSVSEGGLGFGMKWMMGWMHDTLHYFSLEPIHRKFHHGSISFSLSYAFSENFMLPLSHDEVVHGKSSILGKMPGDEWQRFANLRCLYSYMFLHPGTKLLFMGNDLGMYKEWNDKAELDWNLLEFEPHQGVQKLIKSLNKLYTSEKVLYTSSFDYKGFEWIDFSDGNNSVLAFIRKAENETKQFIVVCNFTPIAREEYLIGVPEKGIYSLVLNSDATEYFGSGLEIDKSYKTKAIKNHNFEQSLQLHLPPLSVIILSVTGTKRKKKAKIQKKKIEIKAVTDSDT